jgi:hypothetical protein
VKREKGEKAKKVNSEKEKRIKEQFRKAPEE